MSIYKGRCKVCGSDANIFEHDDRCVNCHKIEKLEKRIEKLEGIKFGKGHDVDKFYKD